MSTIADLLRTRNFAAGDARVLLRETLGVTDAYLIAHADDAVAAEPATRFAALAARRAAGEPVAYLVGEREFYGRVFTVSPAVLIPRPDTELLVALALERLPLNAPRGVLDLGTGSGCIAISIALERSVVQVTATDQSTDALAVAQTNAARLRASNVTFKTGDWFKALINTGDTRAEKFDVMVSNPPYIAEGDAHLTQGDLRFEPASALAAPANGYACIDVIIADARRHLAANGWLLLEHGYDQAAGCRERLRAAGFDAVQSWRDLAGIERVSGGVSSTALPA